MNSKQKPFKFQIAKILIGDWTRLSKYPDDLVAKCYFPDKKIMWEILEDEKTGTNMMRVKRKMQMEWADVLSYRANYATGILDVELSKRPTFFMETNLEPRKSTRWKKTDEDFTLNQSASNCRRHTLHFSSGVLQEMMKKLESGDNFWSELVKVRFPTLPTSLHFDQYDNRNNHGPTLTSNVNSDLLHRQSQEFGRVGVEEGNFNMATQFRPDGDRQMNPFVQSYSQINEHQNRGDFLGSQLNNPLFQGRSQMNNTANQMLEKQVIQQSSHLINEHWGGTDLGSQFYNPLFQGRSQMNSTANQMLEKQVIQQSSHWGGTDLGSQFYNPLFQGMREIENTGELSGTGTNSTIGYGNSNNNNNNSNSSFFNVNNSLLHQQSRGFGRVEVGEINSNIPTHFWYDDGRHMTAIVEDNSKEEQTENLEGNTMICFSNLHRDRDEEERERKN